MIILEKKGIKNSVSTSNETIYRKNAQDFIYLVACSLKNVVPSETILKTMDFQAVYWLSCNHMMASITSDALKKADYLEKLPGTLSNAWSLARYSAVDKNTKLQREAKKILAQLDNAGIWYAPLKGLVITTYYPSVGFREMVDCDILIDEERSPDVKKIMETLGFRTEHYNTSQHDVYHKAPVYNFEMHKKLMPITVSSQFESYFNDFPKRLKKDRDNKYGYHFSNEDMYIFNVAHAYKHYYSGGIGLKILTDIYVINHKFPDINRRYLKQEFKKLSLESFEHQLRTISEMIFSKPVNIYNITFSNNQKKTLYYILGSGAFGTFDNLISNRIHRLGTKEHISFKNRLEYILQRIYPKDKMYVDEYSFFYEHWWAFPFLPVYRIVHRGEVKEIIIEIKSILKVK